MQNIRTVLSATILAALWVVLVVMFGMFCKFATFLFMVGWDMIL